MSDFTEEAEDILKFRQKSQSNNLSMLQSRGSAGNNPHKLAQILSAYDLAIKLLGWENESIADLSSIIAQYQASLDAKYHNDLKDVLIAEEIERRRAERKGISILSK